ncbi:YpbS family protein [Bacillus suaedaesalsae]|uniref:YpbS family protein n=1 Tax=Bacillus suaedaesalsae TaxID=2810349 RepID=A0ABS2DLE8_9BACI|nr:YpbS family protein [Bacillus suaedaesalsae]MBM6619311.1 YpbS family protein [Bacillus suaedaesalsae]
MSVHKEISAHSSKQHELVKQFLMLEGQRERFIDDAVSLCLEGKEFSTESINKVTLQINELAKQGIIPVRKLVTEHMVQEYATKLKGNR